MDDVRDFGSPQGQSYGLAGSGIVGDVILGYTAYRLFTGLAAWRREKIAFMTPPEIGEFRRLAPWRVLKRIAWITGTLVLVLLLAKPDWPVLNVLAYLVALGVPARNYVQVIRNQRRFLRTRESVWDAWLRTQGTSVASVREWALGASYEERAALATRIREEQAAA